MHFGLLFPISYGTPLNNTNNFIYIREKWIGMPVFIHRYLIRLGERVSYMILLEKKNISKYCRVYETCEIRHPTLKGFMKVYNFLTYLCLLTFDRMPFPKFTTEGTLSISDVIFVIRLSQHGTCLKNLFSNS